MPTNTRVIQNRGIYKFTAEEKDAFVLAVYLSCELTTYTNYENVRYPVPKGFLGYAQVRYLGYVVQTIAIEFDNQLLFRLQNDLGQNAVNLALVARQLVPIEVSVSSTTVQFPITDIVFVLQPGWRGIVRVVRDEFINPAGLPRNSEPSRGTPPATGIPPGGLTPPDRAYDNQDDDGFTEPNPFPRVSIPGLYQWAGNACTDSVASRFSCAASVTVVNIPVATYIQPVLFDPGPGFGRYFVAEVDGNLINPGGVGWCNYSLTKIS